MASTTEKTTSGRSSSRSEAKLQKQRARQALQQQQQQQQEQAGGGGGPQGASLVNAVAKVVHGSKILESIDQLRRRKARPSTDRICSFMLRKFSVDVADTITSLKKLLECEAVIEVDYKGGSSYRNAFNWAKIKSYKNRPEGFVRLNLNQATLNDAFGALVLTEPDYIDQGVPPHRLIEQLLEGNVSNPTARRLVEKHLNQEVSSGNLVKLASGNYSLSDSPRENSEIDVKSKNSSSGSSTNGSPVKMYDLDDNTMDHDSRSNSLKSSRQSSPKNDLDKIKNGNYLNIIIGKNLMNENGDDRIKQSNGNDYYKEDVIKQNRKAPNEEKEDTNNVFVQQSYHKRSKSERKQRLCVRSDDSMDLIFSDQKELNYKDENDENDRLSDDGECDQDADRSSANVSPTPSQTNAGNFRSARRKRARKVFDPSDNMVVKKKRGRYSNAVRAAMASAQQEIQEVPKVVAIKENIKNSHRQCNECSKDKDEPLMACRDCTARVHPSCVYTPEEKILKARTSWQCDNCKSCTVCYETKFNGPMVTCYNCNDSYHYGCHTPRVTSSKNKWFCCNCNPKREKPLKSSNANLIKNKIEQQANSNSVPVIVKTRESPVKTIPEVPDDDVQCIPVADNGPPIDPAIPDVTDWDEDQVYRYFVRLFPKDAEVFRTEKIDGLALKLLSKSDIYNRFTSIVFGTRVKIWMQTVYLQKRRIWTGDIWW